MATRKWRVPFGALDKEELLALLSEHKIGLNAYAAQLFMSEDFKASLSSQYADVVEVRVQDLGFKTGAVFKDIVEAAVSRSLQLCPLELAPQLRVQYLDQAEGPLLIIASPKVRADDHKQPNGFYLAHYSGIFWLRGYRATADWLLEPDHAMAFIEGFA